MRIEIVRIGNSRGIRIPKPILEQCGFGNTVELRVEDDHLVISPERKPRHGWQEAFCAAGSAMDDELLLESIPPSRFDSQEWKW